MKQIVPLTIFSVLFSVFASCGGPKYPPGELPASSSESAPENNASTDKTSSNAPPAVQSNKPLVDLGSSPDQLVNTFNAYKKKKRLLMVLSPT